MQLPTIAALTLGCASLASAWTQTPAQIIEEIAPGSASCDKDNAECRTAEQAAPFIFKSMRRHHLYCPEQMAAVIALMAFESVDFAYKRNKYPGRPGQGTANMQMAEFNLEYAKSIDCVKDEVSNITSVDGLPDSELNRILDLVVEDEYNFGSGAWFLSTQCDKEVLKKLRNDIDAGFEDYMECVGVTIDESRLEYLERAKSAFNLQED